MGMCQNIIIPSFKVEQYRPTYYILPANIYGSGIQDASNNICSIYMWTEFEGKKGMNNIASWLLLWINDKDYYYQSYVKNNNIPEIAILFDNWGVQNKNNITTRFLNIIKERELFGTYTLRFYIKIHTKNDCDHAF